MFVFADAFRRQAIRCMGEDPVITPDRKWNRTLLTIAGDHLHYIDLHHYEPDADFLRSVAMPLKYGELPADLKETIASLAPGRNIKLAVMEWNSNSNWQDASKLPAHSATVLRFQRAIDQ